MVVLTRLSDTVARNYALVPNSPGMLRCFTAVVFRDEFAVNGVRSTYPLGCLGAYVALEGLMHMPLLPNYLIAKNRKVVHSCIRALARTHHLTFNHASWNAVRSSKVGFRPKALLGLFPVSFPNCLRCAYAS